MTNLLLPDAETVRRLVFFLSMEEYAADHLRELAPDGAFFIWQVEPTVIFGRNQDMNAEVDVDFCKAGNIAMYRRKSGGGCVFADRGNIMISYIKPCTDVSALFTEFLDRLAAFLCSLGIPARVSGRNDVLVDGRKVSGNAFSLRPGGVGIVHGTFLYDLDFETMSRALTPSRAKLESKGVKSVDQRVMNLKPLLDARGLGLEDLKRELVEWFSDASLTLDAARIEAVCGIEKEYLDPSFIAGRAGVSDDSL
ncbi:MAG: biotin/lipoate A/B protein ligase family protein [Candidatus Cryptobacteroides sp.]